MWGVLRPDHIRGWEIMYRRKVNGWLKHLDFIVLDILCLDLSFILGYYIRHGRFFTISDRVYINMCLVLVLVDLVVASSFNSFHHVLKRGIYAEFVKMLQHLSIVLGVTVFYLFAVHHAAIISRLNILYMILIDIVLAYSVRLLWKEKLKNKPVSQRSSSLVILTGLENVSEIINRVARNEYGNRFVSAVVVFDGTGKTQSVYDAITENGGSVLPESKSFAIGLQVVADKDSLIEYLLTNWVDEILLDIPESLERQEDIVDAIIDMGITVHVCVPEMTKIKGRHQTIERIGEYNVITNSIGDASAYALMFKRVMDIFGGIVGSVITVFLAVIVGPIIYIHSPGPIFFKQKRVGKNGRMFYMYKFRSMYPDAEERKKELMAQNRIKDGYMFKLDYDPRIIGCYKDENGRIHKGIGNFIRDMSIDEFPQFFNVLKGEMSLVGTRPPTLDEWKRYKPEHRARMSTKPGITGLWQVSGRSKITDFDQVVALDKQYIENWRQGLDIKILFKTIWVVIERKGAM
ncbi:sugar transferase [[Clostridium] aminophilum]|nr:sugar transferase [[Clostridium] aminophilum]